MIFHQGDKSLVKPEMASARIQDGGAFALSYPVMQKEKISIDKKEKSDATLLITNSTVGELLNQTLGMGSVCVCVSMHVEA